MVYGELYSLFAKIQTLILNLNDNVRYRQTFPTATDLFEWGNTKITEATSNSKQH